MANNADYQYKLLLHHFGDVPSGWSVAALSEIFAERVEPNANLSKYPLFSFTIEDGVTPKTERYERSFLLRDKKENEYKLVYPNDFVINPMNLRFGAIGYSKINRVVSVSAYYDILKIKRPNVDIDFLGEFLSSREMFNIYNRVATGSLIEKRRVHYSEFRSLKIFCPPQKEQERIGEIIRCWNARIRATENLIAAKVESKRGLMQQLLTGKKRFQAFGGGEWQHTRLSKICKINHNTLSEKTDPNYEFTYLDISSVDKGKIELPKSRIRFASAPSRARRLIKKNDILMSTVRPNLQSFALVKDEVQHLVGSTGFAVITANSNIDPSFIYHNLFSDDITQQINSGLSPKFETTS
jgi:restriction endonuclease S subunit